MSALVVFSGFINVLKFATPLYLLQILDRIPASRSVETLVMLTIVAVFAVAAGVALESVRRRMLTRWGIWIEQRFGAKLFHAGLSGKGRGQSGTPNQSLKDLSTLRTFVAKSAAPWLDIVWAPVFIVGVYLVHPLLGAIGLLAIVALVVLGVLQEIMTREPRRASRHASDDAENIVSAAERNSETVGALSMATNLTEQWQRSVAAQLDERERSEARLASFAAIIQGLGRCMRIGVLGVGVWLFLAASLTLGGIFAARVMSGFAFSLVEKAVRNWRALRDARAAYRRIKAQLALEEDAGPSVERSASEAALVLDKVTFRYQRQRNPIIRQLELTAEPGEVILVVGPAASGKTTLSRLLTGVLEPRYGQIRLGNIDIGRLPAEMRKRLVGYLSQDTRLFKGTVRENIARMGEGEFDDIVAAAKLADIHETIVRLPQGYDTEIAEEMVGLSGSERKRIALARAFYGTPRLIVLDEPEANLDRSSRRSLEEAIKELRRRGCTLVITRATQASRLGRIADRVLILGGGAARVADDSADAARAPFRDAAGGKAGRGRGWLKPVS